MDQCIRLFLHINLKRLQKQQLSHVHMCRISFQGLSFFMTNLSDRRASSSDVFNSGSSSVYHPKIHHSIVSAVPVAGVFHSLSGGDVHVRWERLVHKCAKAHAEVAGGAVHGLSQAFTQRSQAEEIIVHGVGEIHEIVEIHRIVLHLTHLDGEAFGVI